MAKIQGARKQHKSMRGKIVDMERLRKKNELTPAIGNARVNARGDELGPGGKIIRKREDIVKEHYESNPNAVRNVSGKPGKKTLKPTLENTSEIVELTEEEKTLFEEIEAEDEWIEDEDGNFVKKGD